MPKPFHIAGVGEALFDIIAGQPHFGGAPANVACHVSALGAQASLVSKLGEDELGKQAQSILTEKGVATTALQVTTQHDTGTVEVDLDSAGKPSYDIKQNSAWDHLECNSQLLELAPSLQAVCFGTLAQRTEQSHGSIVKFLNHTSKECLHMFDLNLRLDFYNFGIIEASLRLANAVKMNDEELPVLREMFSLSGNEQEQIQELMKRFELEHCAYTCGAEGAYLFRGQEISFKQPPRLESIVSTVGAGDSFTAAVMLGFLMGLALDNINESAQKIAAYVCTQNSATPALPTSLKESFHALV
jgi:fructokinase